MCVYYETRVTKKKRVSPEMCWEDLRVALKELVSNGDKIIKVNKGQTMKKLIIKKAVYRNNIKESAREHVLKVLKNKAGPLYMEMKQAFDKMKVKTHMEVVFSFQDSRQPRVVYVSDQEMNQAINER